MRKFLLIALVCFSVGCSSQVPSDSKAFKSGEALIELSNNKLEEISGLAASETNPGLLWVHNDSGNPAEVYLIDKGLDIKLTCILKGVENRDWEDIAVGPGPVDGKSYVYVADIGDNMAIHPFKYIYRFPEPKVDGSSMEIVITDFDTLMFRLPDAIKDTEALLVNPLTKNLYVVSKREQPVHVYEIKYPYSTTDTITATDIGTLPLTGIVGADFSRDGKEILMKNYVNVFYWKNPGNKSISELLKDKAQVLEYAEEPQGEAITFDRSGSGFFTISEKKKKKKSYLYFYRRN